MKRTLACGAVVVVLAGAVVQAMGQSQARPAVVAGTWAVAMVNRSEPLLLELETDGSTLKGNFAGSRVVGEVKDGQLTFADATSWAAWRAGTIGGDDAAVMYPTVVHARLSENGRLVGWSDVYIRGYGPQAIKRLNWTAVRTPSK